jgi:squalene-associated FAD-dependent desaturase
LDNRVAIVGAGYAGMAAAVTLAARGVPVTVFESVAVPGGRARRVISHGRSLDNGQHIFVGAYKQLFDLMRTVGVPGDALLRVPLEIRYADGFAWHSGLAGLLFARGVSFTERFAALGFITSLKKSHWRVTPDITVKELLDRHRQSGRLRDHLWAPLCVSALNTPVDRASANVFLATLRDTLAGGRGADDLVLPRVDLSQLFPEPAAEFVRARGGEVQYGTTIKELNTLRADFTNIIVAVGPHQLKTLMPDALDAFTYQPIYTCYLQYPETTRLDFPMLGLAGGLVQWVFDRGALLGEKGRLVCVISAGGAHQHLTHDELAARCDRELRHALPKLPAPAWSQVIAEKRATITCAPGLKRPEVSTATTGVFLAGDYTDPEYPPTLEAAVRSGVRAAERVMSS